MGPGSQLIALLLFAGHYQLAASDAKPPAPESQEQRTLESFGAQNAKCEEWSDGCAVCLRQDHDRFACSLPGIACQSSSPTCRREMSVPAAEKPAK